MSTSLKILIFIIKHNKIYFWSRFYTLFSFLVVIFYSLLFFQLQLESWFSTDNNFCLELLSERIDLLNKFVNGIQPLLLFIGITTLQDNVIESLFSLVVSSRFLQFEAIIISFYSVSSLKICGCSIFYLKLTYFRN